MRYFFGLGLLVGLCACSKPDAATPKNVVFICLDTVRADHLGCYGYEARPTTPRLDELAARSIVFSDVSATACWTKPSVPSYMTGTYPLQHGVYQGSSKDEEGVTSDVLPDDAVTVAEVLQGRGYQTAAFVRNAQLRVGQGFEQGFDTYHDEAGDAREIRWRANDWLDAREPGRPFFLYLHMLDAHWPYDIPDEEAARFAPAEAVAAFRDQDWRDLRRRINSGAVTLEDAQRDELVALYDGALRYMDEQLGLLFDRLEREGLLEDTVICVVSDHGEEFLEHGRIGHGHGLYEGLLAVPWILHAPGRAARTIDTPCSLVDLFPTMLDAAGVRAPSSEGVDRLREPDVERLVFAEHLEPGGYEQAWRAGLAKHMRRLEARSAQPAAVEPTFATGRRLEVRYDEAGARVTRIRPSSGDDDKPVELKGPASAVDADGFTVCGVRVLLGQDTEVYGATRTSSGEPRGVQEAMMVKAVGALVADGTFAADKVKLYEDDEELEVELRGPYGGAAEDGSWIVGGLAVAVDADAEIAGPAPRNRMSRLDVVDDLSAELEGELDPARWTEFMHFDLQRDPGERDPQRDRDATRAGPRRALIELLLASRIWDRSDVHHVSEEELKRLRAIGYAE